MRKIYLLLSGIFLFISAYNVTAQTFNFQNDTVILTYTGTGLQNLPDLINNPSTIVTDSVTINWKVIATDFPTDWQGATGICDNKLCYNFPGLWPTSLRTSYPYPNGLGDFHLQTALTTTTPAFDAANGCHYVTVRAYDHNVPADSATMTFIVRKGCATTGIVNPKPSEEIVLYPNPAYSEVNVVYDEASDIKNIAVYNIIGKVMTVYKVNGNSANLNIESIPSGIYFVRLYNSTGSVVVTRKFTKQ